MGIVPDAANYGLLRGTGILACFFLAPDLQKLHTDRRARDAQRYRLEISEEALSAKDLGRMIDDVGQNVSWHSR